MRGPAHRTLVAYALASVFCLHFQPWLATARSQATEPHTSASAPSIHLPPTDVRLLVYAGPAEVEDAPAPERPRMLFPLYLSLGVLQGLDADATIRAVNNGALERNPLLAPFASNRPAMLGTKVAATAITVYASERLWKRSRVAAVALMIGANAGYAWIAAHNYRAARLR